MGKQYSGMFLTLRGFFAPSYIHMYTYTVTSWFKLNDEEDVHKMSADETNLTNEKLMNYISNAFSVYTINFILDAMTATSWL